jgi:hypothetical protein
MGRLRLEELAIGRGLRRVRGSGGEGIDVVVRGRLAGAVGEDQDGGERHDCADGQEEVVEDDPGRGGFGVGG